MVRLAHAEALAATGAREEARVALLAARERLLARAERIAEPAWRHRFLQDVPVNARVLALSEGWRAPSAPASVATSTQSAVPVAIPVTQESMSTDAGPNTAEVTSEVRSEARPPTGPIAVA
jgi:hypothetical protein